MSDLPQAVRQHLQRGDEFLKSAMLVSGEMARTSLASVASANYLAAAVKMAASMFGEDGEGGG